MVPFPCTHATSGPYIVATPRKSEGFDLTFFQNWRDYDVKNSEDVEAAEVKDQLTRKRLGLDAYIRKYDVTLSFRRHGKLLTANAEDLVIAKRGKCNFAVEESVNKEVCLSTRDFVNAKSKSALNRQMKVERMANQTRRRQRRLGFQSDAHAEVAAANTLMKRSLS